MSCHTEVWGDEGQQISWEELHTLISETPFLPTVMKALISTSSKERLTGEMDI